MSVTVRIPSPLRSMTNGRDKVEVTPSTMGELIQQLDAVYPGIRDRLLDDAGEISTRATALPTRRRGRSKKRGGSSPEAASLGSHRPRRERYLLRPQIWLRCLAPVESGRLPR